MIERAAAAGYEALVITVDTANLGRRERDVRRGFELPPKLGLDSIVDGVVAPVMDLAFRTRRADPLRQRRDVGGRHRTAGRDVGRQSRRNVRHASSTPACRGTTSSGSGRIGAGRSCSRGSSPSTTLGWPPTSGVDAIALSNHGGRQLDDAPAALDLVAPVADQVGGRVEIICDGGVRRGSDIVKALALGATACMAGRAYLYGLAAGGELGVDTVLDLLAADVRRTMALLGVARIDELSTDYIEPVP